MAPRWTRPECKTCPLAMFVFVSVPVSVCMSVRRIRPCVCLSVSVCLFIYPFVSLSVRLPAFLYNIILWSGIFDNRRHITVGNGKMDKLHAVTSWIFTQTRTPDYVYSDIYTFVSYAWSIAVICHSQSGIILCMRPANERRRYIVTSSLIGWAHAQNDPCQCNRSMCLETPAPIVSWFGSQFI